MNQHRWIRYDFNLANLEGKDAPTVFAKWDWERNRRVPVEELHIFLKHVEAKGEEEEEKEPSHKCWASKRSIATNCVRALRAHGSIVEFLKKMLELPRTENQLRTLVVLCDYDSRNFDQSILDLAARFPRPITLVVNSVSSFPLLAKGDRLGNIRRLYISSNDWRYWKPEDVRRTRLLDFGKTNGPFIRNRFKNWYKECPCDIVSNANTLIRKVVNLEKRSHVEGEKGNWTESAVPYISDPLNSKEVELAYALRTQRDLTARLHSVCRLVIWANKSPHYLWGLINKDAVIFICSFLSPADWDFQDQKRRNITIKKPKFAKDILDLNKIALNDEEKVRSQEEKIRMLQERRARLQREIDVELPQQIQKASEEKEALKKEAEQSRVKFFNQCLGKFFFVVF
jgi:hypothetical protein